MNNLNLVGVDVVGDVLFFLFQMAVTMLVAIGVCEGVSRWVRNYKERVRLSDLVGSRGSAVEAMRKMRDSLVRRDAIKPVLSSLHVGGDGGTVRASSIDILANDIGRHYEERKKLDRDYLSNAVERFGLEVSGGVFLYVGGIDGLVRRCKSLDDISEFLDLHIKSVKERRVVLVDAWGGVVFDVWFVMGKYRFAEFVTGDFSVNSISSGVRDE